MPLLEITCLFSILIALAYFKPPRKIAMLFLGMVFFLYLLFSHISVLFLGFLGLIFVPFILIFTISSIRLNYITPHILSWFCKALPPINATEKIALEAGGVYWEKELFCGRPDWRKLAAMPQSTLTPEENAFLENQVETLCEMLNDWEMVKTQQNLSPAVWDYLKKEGFFGLQIAKAYGGLGFSVWAHSHIITKISSRSISAGVTVMVPNSLGPAEFLQHFGTAEQQQYYLPRLAKGVEIPAFALTGLEAGSDATAITDTGIVCRGIYKFSGRSRQDSSSSHMSEYAPGTHPIDAYPVPSNPMDIYEGREIIGLKLNWDKRYITLAPVATLLAVAFKMHDPEHLLGEEENLGITLCLLPTHLPGIEIGARHFPSGLAFLNGPTRGRDVFVPLDCIIGGPKMAGRGWHMIMESLAQGRGISLPALSTASMKLCYRMTGAYAKLREQFHLPIGCFEGIAEVLGRMGGLTYLAESTRHFTLSAIAEEVKPSLGAAITKYQLTEMGRMVVNDAMDIHGGHGIQLGPHNYLGLLYQSLPVGITVEGANILTRNLIIFGQGALRCHPFVNEEITATQIENPKERLLRFDQLFCSHVGYTLNQFARVFVYGLTGGLLIRVPLNSTDIPIQLEDTGFASSSSNTKPGGFLRGKCFASPLNSSRNTARSPNTSRDFLRDNVLIKTSALKGERYVRTSRKLLTKYYKQLTRMSTALALVSDMTFAVLGKQLKRKEAISARLGDVLSHLYLASAVIKYFQDQKEAEEEIIFVQWTLCHCLQKIQDALEGALFNFSPRWLGRITHRLIFPWGRAYKKPSDQLTQKIAAQMMKSSAQRDRLTQYCYVGKNADDPTGRIELALQALEKTQTIYAQHQANTPLDKTFLVGTFAQRMKAAEQSGIFSADELKALREFTVLREQALRVDEFSKEILRNISYLEAILQHYSVIAECPTCRISCHHT